MPRSVSTPLVRPRPVVREFTLFAGEAEPRLKNDARLPFLEVAWSNDRLLEFLNREVLPTGSVGQSTALAVERLKYTAGRKCVVLCLLHFSNQREPPRRAVVTFVKDDRLQEVYACHYDRHYNGLAPGPAVYLPAYRCLVEFFPMDWELPSLAHAIDPLEMASLAGTISGLSTSALPSVEVLRYRPHETCVLNYHFGSTDGATPRQLVGKLYRDSDKAERVWRILNELRSQAVDRGVGVPEPLAIESNWGLVLMERVPGASMKRLMREARAENEARDAAKLAAATMAAYHSLRFDGDDELRSIDTELDKLQRRAARLHLVAPSLGRVVDGLLRRLLASAPRYLCRAPALIHGDCKPSQLLIDNNRISVVDFDKASLGDPAIDVGNLMAQFRREALLTGRDHLRELPSYFLAEYQKSSPLSGLGDRAGIFQALSLVRMAVRKFEESPQSYARDGLSSDQVLFLNEAASCLSEL